MRVSVPAAEAVRERAALKQRLLEDRAGRRSKIYREWVTGREAQGDAAGLNLNAQLLPSDRFPAVDGLAPENRRERRRGGHFDAGVGFGLLADAFVELSHRVLFFAAFVR